DAERFLITIEARKLAGTYIDPRAGRIRLADFAQQATAGWVNRRDSTKARDESYLRSLVMPTFADMPIGAITLFDVQAWVSDLDADGYAPATIRKAYQLLGRILNDAVNGGLIAATPCRDVDLPKIEQTEKRFLSPDEITLLADTITPRYRALILTGTYTGLRFGELAALRTDDLDLLRRTLRVDEQLSRQGSWRMVAGPLKSKKAYRTIGIPTFLCEELAIHLTEYPSASDLVFSHAQGGPLDYNRFRRRHWNPAVETSVGPPCTPHDLRHTHVAMLIAENQSPRYIADRLGHESTRTVLDVYGHLYEGIDEAAMEGLDRLRAEARTDAGRAPEGSNVLSMNTDAPGRHSL
ncbi:MAG: tyrosine-type recombinase/integrase, partial [Actinobacteria bacterium]|nr:tyrosine-type recombinase/integrase [Actinomycetota bacterium]